MHHGERLKTLLSGARRSVFIAAPFIKQGAFGRLLEFIPMSVTDIVCVTRWIPEEVAHGVSDLEVLDLIQGREGACLHLHPRLHAKLYRADDGYLIGSANVTDTALGWASPSNLELLIDPTSGRGEVAVFEAELRALAIEATQGIRQSISEAAEALRAAEPARFAPRTSGMQSNWLPTCPNPAGLWNVYASHESWRLVPSAEEAAKRDLQFLQIPAGMMRPAFEKTVASIISGLPLLQEIDALAATGLTTEQAVDVLSRAETQTPYPYEPKYMWEIAKAWLEHFLPGIYRRTPINELWMRGRQIS